MKLQNIEDRLLYIPNKEKGTHLFDGIPHASIRVLEILGSDGIHHIDKKLKTFLLHRMEMFGKASSIYHGFSEHQRFFDLKEQIVLDVKSVLEQNEQGLQDYTIDVNDNPSILIKMAEKEGIERQIHVVKTGVVYDNHLKDFKSS
jgi:hypothetical protein